MQKARLPQYAIEFQIVLDGIHRYTNWTDEELGKFLGVTARTVRSMRKDPSKVNGALILKAQEKLQRLREEYR